MTDSTGVRCRSSEDTMTQWHKGPPPSIGWWPASTERNDGIVRWWNGSVWSGAASHLYSPDVAGAIARRLALGHHSIEWADRPADWPERSRT